MPRDTRVYITDILMGNMRQDVIIDYILFYDVFSHQYKLFNGVRNDHHALRLIENSH